MEKTVVCFANSRKNGERCFAGKSIDDKRWIRPVSNRTSHALNDREECIRGNDCKCPICNPILPQLLDIIRLDISENQCLGHQSENYIHGQERWEKIGILPLDEIDEYIDSSHKTIWHNGYSTSSRINDRVPIGLIKDINDSLMLIEVDNIKVEVYDEDKSYGVKRRINGEFKYRGVSYILPITDSIYEDHFKKMEPGTYVNDRKNIRTILCISLGEELNGFCYKLIAGIMRV